MGIYAVQSQLPDSFDCNIPSLTFPVDTGKKDAEFAPCVWFARLNVLLVEVRTEFEDMASLRGHSTVLDNTVGCLLRRSQIHDGMLRCPLLKELCHLL